MKKMGMKYAAKIAECSEHKYQVGCVIMQGKKILALGFNSTKTHPQSKHAFKTTHAECAALLRCQGQDLQWATCYVYRRLKDGTGAMSKPCASCTAMLKERGVRRVYYTTQDNTWEKEEYA